MLRPCRPIIGHGNSAWSALASANKRWKITYLLQMHCFNFSHEFQLFQLKELPRDLRLAKVCIYSRCQEDGCNCVGWKNSQKPPNGELDPKLVPDFDSECRNEYCKHALRMHISHLIDLPDEQLCEMLGAVVDIENIYISMLKEKNEEIKKIYKYLIGVSVHIATMQPTKTEAIN